MLDVPLHDHQGVYDEYDLIFEGFIRSEYKKSILFELGKDKILVGFLVLITNSIASLTIKLKIYKSSIINNFKCGDLLKCWKIYDKINFLLRKEKSIVYIIF